MQNESCKTNNLKRISKMNNAKQSKILPKGDIFSFYGRLKQTSYDMIRINELGTS